ncbi:MAG: hypothetical protein R3F02_07510 [Thiolinea sp.]
MLNLKDIMGMCDCTEEEIAAVASHEHLPDSVASILADYLIHCDDGVPMLRRIIIEDIEIAEASGKTQQVEELRIVLRHFIANHPEYKGKVNT